MPTLEQLHGILEARRAGASMRRAAAAIGVPYCTVYRWAQLDPRGFSIDLAVATATARHDWQRAQSCRRRPAAASGPLPPHKMVSPIDLYINQSTKLTAKLNAANTGPVGSPPLMWSTSDQTVVPRMKWDNGQQQLASISNVSQVQILGLAVGTATITLTAGALTDNIVVTVRAYQEINIQSVSIQASYQ